MLAKRKENASNKQKQTIKKITPINKNTKKPGQQQESKKSKFMELLEKLMQRLFGVKVAPQTAQETIPYKNIFKDGICQVNDNLFNKTIIFNDINYQLAKSDDQTQIFDAYSEFLNYFDSSISVQLSFINKFGNKKDFEKSIYIPEQDDEFNTIRKEYSDMLKNQLAKGNNGLVKHKYITFGIEAKNLQEAKPRLERIEVDVINNFKTMGVKAYSLTGEERLAVLHGQMHPDGKEKLQFNWKSIPKTGLSTQDFIAPTSFDFRGSKTFKMGNTYGAVSFIQIIIPELSDKMLADFLRMDNAISVNIHIKSIDQQEAIKTVKRQLTDINAMKIDAQKKASRSGYDGDIISNDIEVYGEEAKNLLNELQGRGERMFLATILVLNTATTKKKLENLVFASAGIAQKYNCVLKRLDFQQELGLVSCLPIGLNQVEITRGTTTTGVAIFVPFTTCELFMDGQSLYYGLNALSNNMIMANRKELPNPNGLILGIPGSGKSFSAKREMVNAFIITNDDIVIADPEGEYSALTEKLGGQIIKLSPNSTHYINPMEIHADYGDDEDPIRFKADFILSMCELIAGGKEGLTNNEKSIIDRCVKDIYTKYFLDPKPENMPILEDLWNLIKQQPDPEAVGIATALELYVTGTLNVFNKRTNVDLNNRLVCYDIKELGKILKTLGMLILQDAVWGRVSANRDKKKTTWYYIDEFHLLLKDELTANYSIEIWKRFRKWGGVPTGITQNIKDFLGSKDVENIFENSPFILMLSQASGDRAILAKSLGISEHQLGYVTNSGPGEGLLFFNSTIIPFIDRFPKDTELYSIMTTKLEETVTEGASSA